MDSVKILLVEANTTIRQMLEEILIYEVDLRFEVVCCENGTQALYMLHEHRLQPDLIVSGIKMRGMDGFEMLQAIRNESRWQHIPILFLSMLNNESEMHRARQMGIENDLIKPFPVNALLQAIYHYLGYERIAMD